MRTSVAPFSARIEVFGCTSGVVMSAATPVPSADEAEQAQMKAQEEAAAALAAQLRQQPAGGAADQPAPTQKDGADSDADFAMQDAAAAGADQMPPNTGGATCSGATRAQPGRQAEPGQGSDAKRLCTGQTAGAPPSATSS